MDTMKQHLCYVCGYLCDCGVASVDTCVGCSPCAESGLLSDEE